MEKRCDTGNCKNNAIRQIKISKGNRTTGIVNVCQECYDYYKENKKIINQSY